MLFFTMSNFKNASTYKWRRVVQLRKLFYSGISKLVLLLPSSFHILCTILFTVYFYTIFSMFLFLFHWSHLKAGAIPSSDSYLFRKRSTIGQLNVQAATAKNEQQYTLSNRLCIAFQKFYSFLWNVLHWKMIVVEFIFWQNYRLGACNITKSCALAFSKDCTRICNLSIYFDILATSISQNTFQ